ncbi:BCCT family transporter, partial [Staphylococcus auricularis]|uniref:BCCT family transporter n=1 Tax=Staphylococcus auricularis TaxID=29379 RepID=UPI001CD91AA4
MLKPQTDKFLPKILHLLFIFPLLPPPPTSLPLALPLISSPIQPLTALHPHNILIPTAILLTITLIFPITSYTPFKKPIQKLTHLNLSLSFFLLIFLFLLPPTLFIIQTTLTPFPNIFKNFFQIPSSLQPFPPIPPPQKTPFPQHWTIFYSSSC